MRTVIAVLALLVLGATASGQTTYTQTTHACITTGCSDAQFTPASTLSYGIRFDTCGQKDVTGFATWNGTEYEDLKASMVWLGYHYNGKNYYPDGIWQVEATFNGGTMSLTETFRAYRNCSAISNLDGKVVTP